MVRSRWHTEEGLLFNEPVVSVAFRPHITGPLWGGQTAIPSLQSSSSFQRAELGSPQPSGQGVRALGLDRTGRWAAFGAALPHDLE